MADLGGEWLNYYSESIEEYFRTGTMAALNVLGLLIRFLNSNNIDVKKIGIAVIAFPGIVGQKHDVSLTNYRFREELLEQLIPFINEDLECDILVKNDMNLAAVGQMSEYPFAESQNLYLLSGDIGLGSGLILNRKLYEGDMKAAGEVGFAIVCNEETGRYETLEERIGLTQLVKRYEKAIGRISNFEQLKNQVERREEEALLLYESVLQDISIVLSNVSTLLDIRQFAVGGRLFELSPQMISQLNVKINKMTPFGATIYKVDLEKMALTGAVELGIHELMKHMLESGGTV